jgi:hypothetical protein
LPRDSSVSEIARVIELLKGGVHAVSRSTGSDLRAERLFDRREDSVLEAGVARYPLVVRALVLSTELTCVVIKDTEGFV